MSTLSDNRNMKNKKTTAGAEQLYKLLIDNANIGIGLFDTGFKPIISNLILQKELGYSKSEYDEIIKNKFRLFHPDDVLIAKQAMKNLFEKRKTEIEVRLQRKDGVYNYYSISFTAVDYEGKQAILVFLQNITKQKAAEKQKEEYRNFLEAIMDNIPVSLFAKTTPDLRYLYWNRMQENVTGISTDEAIGKTDFEIFPFKKLAEMYNNEDAKLLKKGERIESEHNFTTPTGAVKKFKTIKTLYKSNVGNPIVLGISMDITRLKETEKQLEQSSQMLKEAQSIAKLGYWEYDINKDLIFDNTENREILGTSQLSFFINSEQFFELLIEQDRGSAKEIFNRCLSSGDCGEGVVRIAKNGEVKFISIKCKPVKDNTGKVIKLRGTSLDITDIRKSQIALQQKEIRIRQAEQIAKIGFIDINNSKIIHLSETIKNILEVNDDSRFNTANDYDKYIYKTDKHIVLNTISESIKKGESYSIRYRLHLADKKVKYVYETGLISDDDAGTYTRIIQDITKTREIMDGLLEKKELFEAITDNSIFAIVIYQDGKFVFTNNRWAQLTGIQTDNNTTYDVDQVYDKTTTELIKGLFKKWDNFKLKEYSNKMALTPINAPKFIAEVFVKETIYNNKKAMLIIAFPDIK